MQNGESYEVLKTLLAEEQLAGVPLLVFANKAEMRIVYSGMRYCLLRYPLFFNCPSLVTASALSRFGLLRCLINIIDWIKFTQMSAQA